MLSDSTKLRNSASLFKSCVMAFPGMIPLDCKSIRKLTFPLSTWRSLLRMEVLSSTILLALIYKGFHSWIRTELDDYFKGLKFKVVSAQLFVLEITIYHSWMLRLTRLSHLLLIILSETSKVERVGPLSHSKFTWFLRACRRSEQTSDYAW